MITANEARVQQAGNNLQMIEKNISEIQALIKAKVRSSGECYVTHYINGMANASAVALKVKEYGYAVNCANSTDPRDGNIVVMKIQW